LDEDNPVRAVDVFVDELDLAGLGFGGVEPEATGRLACHPATRPRCSDGYRRLTRVSLVISRSSTAPIARES
jgi:hypothetical protein